MGSISFITWQQLCTCSFVHTSLGHDLLELEEVMGSDRITLELCITFCIIVCRSDCYCLVLKDQDLHPLPNPTHTTIHERRNWVFHVTTLSPEPLETESLPQPSIRGAPLRHSFAIQSIGYSSYDFSDIYSTLDAIIAKQADHRWIADEYNAWVGLY